MKSEGTITRNRCVINPPDTSTKVGVFNGVTYIRHRGLFKGTTINGHFLVPYSITAPEEPARGNQTAVFEPPHGGRGPIARDDIFGQSFFFERGFSHASVGYDNIGLRLLEGLSPDVQYMLRGKLINRILPFPGPHPGPNTDYEILKEFGRCLNPQEEMYSSFISFRKVYGIGFSDSGIAVNIIYEPFQEAKVFDICFPCIAFDFEPVRGENKIIKFNAEAEYGLLGKVPPVFDPKEFPSYRCYDFPGGGHIPDTAIARSIPTPPFLPLIAGTSPADWTWAIKAVFVAGDEWVGSGMGPERQPPDSALLRHRGGFLDRDDRCNALGGIPHPALTVGEATFVASIERGLLPPAPRWPLNGGYGYPRPRISWGAEKPGAYARAFEAAVKDLVEARFLLVEDAKDLMKKANMDPEKTFTESYMAGLFPSSLAVEPGDEESPAVPRHQPWAVPTLESREVEAAFAD